MPTLNRIEGYPDYYQDPVSGIVSVRFWVGGERKTRSTGVKAEIPPTAHEMKLAISAGRKKIANHDKERALKRAASQGSVLVADWVPKWLESLKTTWKSVAARKDAESRWNKHLSKFFFVRDGRPLDVKEVATEGFWLEYAVKFQRENPGLLLFHHRAYLRHFFYYMHEQRDQKTNERLLPVVPELKDFDPARETPGRAITPEEEEKLLAQCKTERHKLQILMGIYMGMRPGEVCTISKKFINWENMEIELPATFVKTGRIKKHGRSVPIHPKVAPLLKAQCASHKFDPLFPSPKDPKKPIARSGNRSAWKRIKQHTKIKGRLRRHDMRVTRATRFAEQGVSEQLSQDVLGMSKEVLDRHYKKFSARVRKKVFENEQAEPENKAKDPKPTTGSSGRNEVE
jgi:integrase